MAGPVLDPGLLALLGGGLGLILGSFIGLVADRMPRDEDVIFRPSRCDACGRPLKPWHMIPVMSWLGQRGRAADCGAHLSPRLPAIELAAAALGVWAALHHQGEVWPSLVTAGLGWQLLLIALIDAEHFWLPDVLTWPLALSGLVAAALLTPDMLMGRGIGMVAGFVILWGLGWLYQRLRSRQGLGGGDPFLFGAGGAWVGWIGLPSVLLWGSAAGLSLVLARLILRRPVAMTDRLPFGTFLAAGVWLVWLYGPLGL